mmetsp:Transcript_26189/g.57356  ORF Transcript_26189/g.57356 Transcript_26189/m.57356 type:complete len:207 (+) Transcript_26189:1488-2108(+)
MQDRWYLELEAATMATASIGSIRFWKALPTTKVAACPTRVAFAEVARTESRLVGTYCGTGPLRYTEDWIPRGFRLQRTQPRHQPPRFPPKFPPVVLPSCRQKFQPCPRPGFQPTPLQSCRASLRQPVPPRQHPLPARVPSPLVLRLLQRAIAHLQRHPRFRVECLARTPRCCQVPRQATLHPSHPRPKRRSRPVLLLHVWVRPVSR